MDYSFSYDERRNLLSVKQSGYWALETFRAFEQEFLGWHAKIRARHDRYCVIAECADYRVQSNEVGEAFGRFFTRLMAENLGRYAILVGSTLNAMQAKRVFPQPHVQVFTDRDAAMAWLFEGG